MPRSEQLREGLRLQQLLQRLLLLPLRQQEGLWCHEKLTRISKVELTYKT